ncbi:hypothetical protein CPAV1605_1554 [seawater metagenome]|uniref:Uncharacterized protein n=1 Tax=seawater metagenome TaxID=1561972 RepID=A0A5E8CKD2_9ZZZZ
MLIKKNIMSENNNQEETQSKIDPPKCSRESLYYGILIILVICGGIFITYESKKLPIYFVLIEWLFLICILTCLLIKYRLSFPARYHEPLLFPYTTYGILPYVQIDD